MGKRFPAWLFPFVTVVISAVATGVAYTIARIDRRLNPIAFISDCGAQQPESSIFSQGVNFAAFFLWMTVNLRHQLVKQKLPGLGRGCIGWITRACWNPICLVKWLGYFSAAGVSVLGNFQTGGHVACRYFHLGGAGAAFLLGLLYVIGETVFSYKMMDAHQRTWKFLRWFALLRTVLALLCAVSLPVLLYGWFNDEDNFRISTTPMYYDMFRTSTTAAYVNGGKKMCHMSKEYIYAEWTLALFFLAFISTFAYELSDFNCHHLHLEQVNENSILSQNGEPKIEEGNELITQQVF